MKRALSVFVAMAMFLGPINAIAAVKAGDTCKKAGSTATFSGKKFTCVKSGKKLVWNKGVAVAPTKPIVPVVPTSFDDLEQNYQGVAETAWKKSAQVFATSKAKAIDLKILIGPNTKPVYEIPQVAISQVSRMFPNYKEAKEFVLIYFNFKDVAWAEEQFDKYIGTNGGYDTSGEVKKLCPGEKACNSAAAVRNQVTGIQVTLITAGPASANDKHFLTGAIEAHEYFHTVQNVQFEGSSKNNGMMPRWLHEGFCILC